MIQYLLGQESKHRNSPPLSFFAKNPQHSFGDGQKPKISTSFDQFDSFYTRKPLKKKKMMKMAGIYEEYSKTFIWKVAWHNTYSHGRFVFNRKNIHSLSLPSLSGFSTFKARLSLNLSSRYLSEMAQLTFLFRWIRHCSVSLLTTWYDHVTQKSALRDRPDDVSSVITIVLKMTLHSGQDIINFCRRQKFKERLPTSQS